jgi:hypothetical protein
MKTDAPFPYFGGKRRVAPIVWRAFGPDVPNYVEPFFGSGAVLLGRPGGPGKIETVNDLDRMVANFWRAVAANPDDVVKWADWPVNEADMHARHRWLVAKIAYLREQMHVDPDFFDVKIAGWWVWGICMWIGGGWCVEPDNHKLPKLDGIGKGIHSDHGNWRQLSDLQGKGVHKISTWNNKLHLRQRPDMSCAGRGVHIPSLGNDRGIHGVSAPPCTEWFKRLQARLRRVRVACGNWKRVVSPSVLGKGKNVGGRRPCAVFLDPPYPHDVREAGIYGEDDENVWFEAKDWAIEHGSDPDLRIALCGYDGDHGIPHDWTEYAWKAARGYASEENDNRNLERIWFSPHCLPIDSQQSLFTELERNR